MNQKAPISVPQVCADLLTLISSAGDLRATKGLKETWGWPADEEEEEDEEELEEGEEELWERGGTECKGEGTVELSVDGAASLWGCDETEDILCTGDNVGPNSAPWFPSGAKHNVGEGYARRVAAAWGAMSRRLAGGKCEEDAGLEEALSWGKEPHGHGGKATAAGLWCRGSSSLAHWLRWDTKRAPIGSEESAPSRELRYLTTSPTHSRNPNVL